MSTDVDVSVPAALLGNPGRARLVLALVDGRALPASALASEAGVAASTASEHLAKLCDAGMLAVEPHGRHRYYRLASPQVARAMEALAEIAPPAPIRSLRQHSRAYALREGRLCYDHLAGRLGVTVMRALITGSCLQGGDGIYHPESEPTDRLSAAGHDVDYRLTAHGAETFTKLGIDLDELSVRRRPAIRYCLDWTEQRHHLAGGLGAALADRLIALGWLTHATQRRVVRLTEAGQARLPGALGVDADDDLVAEFQTIAS
jgi:DNA-binding transcriptional ArsR family regulator